LHKLDKSNYEYFFSPAVAKECGLKNIYSPLRLERSGRVYTFRQPKRMQKSFQLLKSLSGHEKLSLLKLETGKVSFSFLKEEAIGPGNSFLSRWFFLET
jgi:hypothetical protein